MKPLAIYTCITKHDCTSTDNLNLNTIVFAKYIVSHTHTYLAMLTIDYSNRYCRIEFRFEINLRDVEMKFLQIIF